MVRPTGIKPWLLSSLLLVGTSIVVGQRLPLLAGGESSSGQQPAVLRELLDVRKAVGGSVLQGTTLEPTSAEDAETRFLEGVQEAAKSLSADQPGRGTADATIFPHTDACHEASQTIAMLRKHSAQLDEIANDLECQRGYDHADRLRASATALRMLARQLDR